MRKNNSKAFALIAILWISVILITIVAVVNRTARLENSLTRSQTEQIKMRWAARAAFENFIMTLDLDLTDDDGPLDDWYSTQESPSSYLAVEIDGFDIMTVVDDLCARFNINTIDAATLQKLPGMDQQKASCIIDWRDEDSQVSSDGAEDSYYLNLKPGYNAANGRFRFINELLAVKGFQNKDVFETTEKSPIPLADYLTCYSASKAGSSQLNINQASQQELQQTLGLSEAQAKGIVDKRQRNQFKSVNDLLEDNARTIPSGDSRSAVIDITTFCQIADQITVEDTKSYEGRININTAGREVLMALLNDNSQLVQQIIGGQATGGYISKTDILLSGFVTPRQYKDLADKITVNTDVFAVTCTVTSKLTNNSFVATAVISRLESPASILFYYE